MNVADTEETPVVVPVPVPVVEVQVALRIVPVETDNVAIAIDLRRYVRKAIRATVHRILTGLYSIRNLVLQAFRTNSLKFFRHFG